ncbi:hypothetical protein EIP91_007568 [Steccherinum ochraceum]|uniref:Uncharacterized protein n=1 Tax=Steccherinum ochraceum TaxID=92696 RepID=A0A4R0RQJ8_9APHY|nr:hypothetical protein EIP91_007568 [Steccherinum ochraceum]
MLATKSAQREYHEQQARASASSHHLVPQQPTLIHHRNGQHPPAIPAAYPHPPSATNVSAQSDQHASMSQPTGVTGQYPGSPQLPPPAPVPPPQPAQRHQVVEQPAQPSPSSSQRRAVTPDLGCSRPVVPAARGRAKVLRPRDYYHMARLAATYDPWGAGHGHKMKTWDALLKELKRIGCCGEISTHTLLMNKVNMMVDHHDKGDLPSTNKDIADALDAPEGHLFAAQLDRALHCKEQAEEKARDKDVQSQKKSEENETGGYTLREGSLQSQTNPDEIQASTSSTSADGSAADDAEEDGSPPRKRRRTIDHDMKVLLEKNLDHSQDVAERDDVFQSQVLEHLKEGNRLTKEANDLYAEKQDALLDILRKAYS